MRLQDLNTQSEVEATLEQRPATFDDSICTPMHFSLVVSAVRGTPAFYFLSHSPNMVL